MKEGSKEGLQQGAANVACSEGFCNGRGCNKVMQHRIAIGRVVRRGVKVDANKRGRKNGKQCGIAIGRGAMVGATVGAKKRGARGGCKTALQMLYAVRGFAMGEVATK